MNQEINKYKAALKRAANKIEELAEQIKGNKANEDIAIIGYSCRFPGGANNPNSFWNVLEKGIDTVSEIPDSRFDKDKFYSENRDDAGKMYTKSGAFLNIPVDEFDNTHFGISPIEASSMDPQQRLFLEISWEAMENAGLNIQKLKGSLTGVFVGINGMDYVKAHLLSGNVNKISPYSITGISFNAVCGRLSYFYDFKGPSIAFDTACSSSLAALNAAVQSLRKNECDMAVVGGVNLLLSPESFIGLSKINGLSKDGRCKAFDASADGFGRGEGSGVVILKRLSDAKQDYNSIYAVVKSVSVGQDGKTNGFTAPNGIAQRNVIRQALEQANLYPDDIDYIEAHGAGTELGDVIEAQTLSEVFRNRKRNLLIGTVKSNIGHLEGAAGMAGLIKVILSLQNGKIPQSIHFSNPNPNINWDNISVVNKLTEWRSSEKKRRAGISSFGFSGTLAHAIIEESPVMDAEEKGIELPYHLLTLSAKDEDGLRAAVNNMKEYLSQTGNSINDICYTSNISRSYLDYRFAISAKKKEDFINKIESVLKNSEGFDEVSSNYQNFLNDNMVFLFTGQGSIYSGIGKRLYETSSVFREAMDLCSDKFKSILDISILDAIYNEDKSLLGNAIYSQPVIFSVELALAKIWASLGIRPRAVIGHSIGEYAAACFAGMLSLDDAVKMIAFRGKMMDSVKVEGKMIGVLTSESVVKAGILESGCKNVSIAAVNAPENVTISGLSSEVDLVIEKIQEKQRVFIDRLRISHPFHSIVMKPYIQTYLEQIKDVSFSKLNVNMISTVTGKLEYEKTIGETGYWANHLCNTVRYYEAIETANKMGYSIFIEIGGNATLSGLANQCISDENTLFLPTLRQGLSEYKQIFNSISSLYLRGIEIDWNNFYSCYKKEKIILPNYPFQKKKFWIDIMNDVENMNDTKAIQYLSDEKSGNMQQSVSPAEVVYNYKADVGCDEIQTELKQIINIITGLDLDEIRNDTNLFSLGFDSLMLMNFKKRIDGKYRMDISVNEFFIELNTVAKIASYIHSNLSENYLSNHETPTGNNFTGVVNDGTGFLSFFEAQIGNLQKQLEDVKSIGKQKFLQSQFSACSVERTEFPKLNYSAMVFEDEKLNPKQKAFVQNFIIEYNKKTKKSKQVAEEYKETFADWINSLNFRTNLKEVLYPVVSSQSKGTRFWDIDGNEYIDLAIGYGVHYFGHNPDFIKEAIEKQLSKGYELGPQCELAGKVAMLIKELTGVERVAFCNTGSEAVMVALRISRAISKKNKIVKFSGSYHGIFDGVLTDSDDEGPFPTSKGTTYGMVKDTISLIYGSSDSLNYIDEHKHEIAAVLVEPVQSRKPGFQPKKFLQQLKELTAKSGIILIFDEMINGFRIHPGGAQAYFGIKADIVIYGKIVGGGMPIGVVAGKKEYIDAIDGGSWNFGDASKPAKETIVFAGTFCKHPLTMAASHAALSYMKQRGETLQNEVNKKTELFVNRVNDFFESEDVPIKVQYFGSQFRFESFGRYDLALLPFEMDLFFYLLNFKGVYTWERRTCCFCTEITENDIEIIVQKIKESIYELRGGGFSFSINDKLSVPSKNNDFPMSAIQKRLYTLIKIDNEDPYNIIGTLTVKGSFDVGKVEDAFKQLVKIHETLRTRLYINGDEFLQEVLDDVDFKVNIIQKDASKDLDELIDETICKFDLSMAPLFRVSLIELSEDEKVLLIDLHHTIADGLSINIMAQDFMKLYSGQTIKLVPKQYCDYVMWEKEFLNSEKIVKCEEYWVGKLAREISKLEIPLNFKRPAELNYSGNTVKFRIEEDTVAQLKDLSKKSGVSLFMVLISAFNILLQKLSGNDEVIIGTPVTNRNNGAFDRNIGMFTNTMVLRNVIKSEMKYLDFLLEVKQCCLEAYANMDYPFNLLVNKLNVKRELNRNPLFDVMFIYENANDRVFKIADLEVKSYDYKIKTAMFDLTLEILEENGYFVVDLNYKTDLFEEATIIRWGQYFKTILDEILADSDITIADIELLSEDEKNLLITQFNSTEIEYSREKAVHELFEEQVEKVPDSVATVCGGIEMTYDELNRRANRVAHLLKEKGVKKDTIVGLMVERSHEMIISILGILKAGGAYLPIDPDYPVSRIEYMLEDSGVNILVAHRHLIENVSFDGEVIDIAGSEFKRQEESNMVFSGTSRDLAYVIYTSGSTGKPKGIMLEHQGVVNFIKGMTESIGFSTDKSILAVTTISFDIFVLETLLPLSMGMKIVIADAQEQDSPEKLCELIRINGISILQATPSRMKLILSCDKSKERLNNLEAVIVGGEAFPFALLDEIKRKLSGVKIYNVYGPTETTVWSSVKELTKDSSISIGKPIANTQMYIVDGNNRLQPLGAAGELCIGGDGLARGYFNRPELTSEKFIPNPFVFGKRMYKTGDLARWLKDGNIEFLGRIDYQVKVRGYRIELGEIEKQLLKNSNINEAVVVAKEDGSGNNCLCAYFAADRELHGTDLRGSLSRELPQYMVPTYFIQLEKLPLTPNGKVDRKALPEPEGNICTEIEFVPSSNETEAKLVEIWQEILCKECIGINDNFFELGGDSLKATLMVLRIHKEADVEIPLKEVFRKPTVKELAACIKECEGSIYNSIEPIDEKEFYPVSAAQKRLYILSQFEGAGTSYNMPGIMTIDGELDRTRLENTFTELIKRHETLRTSFEMANGEPVQRVWKEVDFKVEYIELAEREIDTIGEEFTRPFDLNKAPLLRVGLVTLNSNKHLMLYDMHHIISDGASMNILAKEFTQLYQEKSLPLQRIQYKDFSAWQNQLFISGGIKKQEEYWLNRFGGDVPVLNMPTDYPRLSEKSFEGDRIIFEAGKEIVQGLSNVMKETGTTMYMVLLGAYNVLLHRYTGQEDIVVGSPIEGRPHADLQGMIGMFVNALAMRNQPRGEKLLKEFLLEVKESCLNAYENQEYQFEELVDKLNLKKDMGRNPLFDTVMALRNTGSMDLQIDGLNVMLGEANNRTSKFDMTLNVSEDDEKLVFELEYCSRLFKRSTVERIAGHFINILNALYINLDSRLGDICFLDDAEVELLLKGFNDSLTDYPKDIPLHNIFENRVEEYPEKTALVYGSRRVTFFELNESANRIARVLVKNGITENTVVGLLMDRSVEMIAFILGILKAGACYLPIDVSYPAGRAKDMLEDSEAVMLLAHSRFVEKLSEAGIIQLLPDTRVIDIEELLRASEAESGENLDIKVSSNAIAYIMYTSGSTGKPKGNLTTHYNISRIVIKTNYIEINAEDVLLQLSNYAFDGSTFDIFGAMLNGATLVLMDRETVTDINRLSDVIENESVTMFFITAALFNTLVDAVPECLRNVRKILVGGEKLSVPHISKAFEYLGPNRIVNGYGPTESTVFATSYNINEIHEDQRTIPIGRPVTNTRLYVVDKYNKLCPIGVHGELCISGDGLALGYLNRSELTKEKFVYNPYESDANSESVMYRTGDIVKWLPDGNIEFLGRIDHQVKIRGFRIELGEIEIKLLKFEGIKNAIVIAREDNINGKHLCAYFVSDKDLTVHELSKHLLKELPEYMIPSYFVQLEKIPLTANGKVDMKALPEPASNINTGVEYEAPRNELEEKLVAIWQEVLQVENISIHANFFELGGNSLKVMLIIKLISKTFNVSIGLKSLFENPTVQSLAGLLALLDNSDVNATGDFVEEEI